MIADNGLIVFWFFIGVLTVGEKVEIPGGRDATATQKMQKYYRSCVDTGMNLHK